MSSTTSSSNPKLGKKVKSLGKDFFASVFWLYLIVKVFVYDVDKLLVERYAPGWEGVIDYRYFIFLGLTAILWMFLGNKRFWLFILRTLAFPIIILFWRIPKNLFTRGNWFFILAYINSIANVIKSLKRNVILTALFSIGTLLLLAFNSSWTVILGSSLITLTLILHYTDRAMVAFQPLTFLAVDSQTLLKALDYDEMRKKLESSTQKQVSKNDSSDVEGEQKPEDPFKALSNLLLFNRIFLFLATNLRRFRDSKLYVLFFSFSLLGTFLFTILCASLINYGVYRFAPENFAVTTQGHFVDFVFYSFYAIFNTQVGIITPNSILTRLILMSEGFFGLVLLVLLVSIFFTTQSERYKEELDSAIEVVRKQGADLGQRITVEFSMSPEKAEEVLQESKHSMSGIIVYFSKRI